MLRVVLAGQGRLLTAFLAGLLESGHSLRAVVSPDRLPVAVGNGVWVRRGDRLHHPSTLRRLVDLQPDVLLVGSWGERLREPVLSLPRLGCVNCHPSLLPRHRGSNPYLSAIVGGETQTGVTFHRMIEQWDAGRLLLQEVVPIHPEDTGGALRDRCAEAAAALLVRLLDGLEEGALREREQDHTAASTFPEPGERDREVDWRQSARRVHDRIRGMLPWYRCYSYVGRRRITFGGSEVVPLPTPARVPGQILAATGNSLLVATGDPERGVRVGDVRLGDARGPRGRWGGDLHLVGRRLSYQA